MHVASQCGHPETALMFLKKGVPLHMPNKAGAVCLHAAAKRGHVAVVKSLLQKGALVDTKTKDNYTALHIAVQHCKPLVVQTLLGHGAQVQLKGGKRSEIVRVAPTGPVRPVPGQRDCSSTVTSTSFVPAQPVIQPAVQPGAI
ncbi:ankyrin-3-like [Patiria miniata]|uniref:Uncharacterized protein n=1 Tax=Patiria miniata TaxID=46514 RepID=A0A914AJU5_PATMI|nr:ankyrin-3-like [Patiria miniata]